MWKPREHGRALVRSGSEMADARRTGACSARSGAGWVLSMPSRLQANVIGYQWTLPVSALARIGGWITPTEA